jgi:hypothetical protein
MSGGFPDSRGGRSSPDGYANPPLIPLPAGGGGDRGDRGERRRRAGEPGESDDAANDANDANGSTADTSGGRSKALALSFVLMVVVGLGNKLFQIFETGPMHNYPFFLNFLSTFIYVPVSFLYILPMQRWGSAISKEQTEIPKRLFAVMGMLDGAAGLMQGFATNYITKRPMIILLQQAAIPSSMLISKLMLNAKYRLSQYLGAIIVFGGIIVVVIPGFLPKAAAQPSDEAIAPSRLGLFQHGSSSSSFAPSPSSSAAAADVDAGDSAGSQIIWVLVMLLSCVPMCLSSVFKEKALGDCEIDVVYLNGWVAVFQLLFTVVMAVPAAYTSGLTVEDVPSNFFGGMKCYAGIDSNSPGPNGTTYIDSLHGGPHECAFLEPAGGSGGGGGGGGAATTNLPQCDNCASSTVFVSVYLLFNIGYNLLIILILKFGSSNVLWLAMTVMVPLGNAAFYIPGIPGHTNPSPFDLAGLLLIMFGLLLYRFAEKCKKSCCGGGDGGGGDDDDAYSALGRRSGDRPRSERSRGKSRAASFFDNDADEQVGLVVARSRVGINGIEVLQAVMQSAAKRHPAIRPDLVRSPEQIRFGFLRRLGVNTVGDRQLNRPLNQQGSRVGRVSSQEVSKRFY